MIGLISCVKSKPCAAKDMYISPLFRYMYSYAKKRCSKVYILSAKYGLIPENAPIAPYNKTLNTMTEIQKQKWAAMVVLALQKRYNVQNECFLILGGGELYKIFKFTAHSAALKGIEFGK